MDYIICTHVTDKSIKLILKIFRVTIKANKIQFSFSVCLKGENNMKTLIYQLYFSKFFTIKKEMA